jgi:hypothetical protein
VRSGARYVDTCSTIRIVKFLRKEAIERFFPALALREFDDYDARLPILLAARHRAFA